MSSKIKVSCRKMAPEVVTMTKDHIELVKTLQRRVLVFSPPYQNSV